MSDPRRCGDDELSLQVINDEDLYNAYRRVSTVPGLRALVSCFTYTEAQWRDMLDTWRGERQQK